MPAGSSTLSLPDALPISCPPPQRTRRLRCESRAPPHQLFITAGGPVIPHVPANCPFVGATSLMWEFGTASQLSDGDRKSTRLNSSHSSNSYAVFCLTKKI